MDSDDKLRFPRRISMEQAARTVTDADVERLRQLAYRIQQAAVAEEMIQEARRKALKARAKTEEMEAELHAQRFAARAQLTGKIGRPGKRSDKGSPTIDWELDDRELEALALKVVVRIAKAAPEGVDREWLICQTELGERLPPYVAAEVLQRAQEMLDLLR